MTTGDGKYVLQIVADALLGVDSRSGSYVKSMNFEINRGRGAPVVTTDINEALAFDTSREAFEYWRTQSKTCPLRPDGKPNRPLTAFSVTITRR